MARILIVDDEPSMRRILASNLRQEGYEVIEAAGLAAARAAIAEDPFDAVITDQKMGDGEGLEVLGRRARGGPRGGGRVPDCVCNG